MRGNRLDRLNNSIDIYEYIQTSVYHEELLVSICIYTYGIHIFMQHLLLYTFEIKEKINKINEMQQKLVYIFNKNSINLESLMEMYKTYS